MARLPTLTELAVAAGVARAVLAPTEAEAEEPTAGDEADAKPNYVNLELKEYGITGQRPELEIEKQEFGSLDITHPSTDLVEGQKYILGLKPAPRTPGVVTGLELDIKFYDDMTNQIGSVERNPYNEEGERPFTTHTFTIPEGTFEYEIKARTVKFDEETGEGLGLADRDIISGRVGEADESGPSTSGAEDDFMFQVAAMNRDGELKTRLRRGGNTLGTEPDIVAIAPDGVYTLEEGFNQLVVTADGFRNNGGAKFLDDLDLVSVDCGDEAYEALVEVEEFGEVMSGDGWEPSDALHLKFPGAGECKVTAVVEEGDVAAQDGYTVVKNQRTHPKSFTVVVDGEPAVTTQEVDTEFHLQARVGGEVKETVGNTEKQTLDDIVAGSSVDISTERVYPDGQGAVITGVAHYSPASVVPTNTAAHATEDSITRHVTLGLEGGTHRFKVTYQHPTDATQGVETDTLEVFVKAPEGEPENVYQLTLQQDGEFLPVEERTADEGHLLEDKGVVYLDSSFQIMPRNGTVTRTTIETPLEDRSAFEGEITSFRFSELGTEGTYFVTQEFTGPNGPETEKLSFVAVKRPTDGPENKYWTTVNSRGKGLAIEEESGDSGYAHAVLPVGGKVRIGTKEGAERVGGIRYQGPTDDSEWVSGVPTFTGSEEGWYKVSQVVKTPEGDEETETLDVLFERRTPTRQTPVAHDDFNERLKDSKLEVEGAYASASATRGRFHQSGAGSAYKHTIAPQVTVVEFDDGTTVSVGAQWDWAKDRLRILDDLTILETGAQRTGSLKEDQHAIMPRVVLDADGVFRADIAAGPTFGYRNIGFGSESGGETFEERTTGLRLKIEADGLPQTGTITHPVKIYGGATLDIKNREWQQASFEPIEGALLSGGNQLLPGAYRLTGTNNGHRATVDIEAEAGVEFFPDGTLIRPYVAGQLKSLALDEGQVTGVGANGGLSVVVKSDEAGTHEIYGGVSGLFGPTLKEVEGTLGYRNGFVEVYGILGGSDMEEEHSTEGRFHAGAGLKFRMAERKPVDR